MTGMRNEGTGGCRPGNGTVAAIKKLMELGNVHHRDLVSLWDTGERNVYRVLAGDTPVDGALRTRLERLYDLVMQDRVPKIYGQARADLIRREQTLAALFPEVFTVPAELTPRTQAS